MGKHLYMRTGWNRSFFGIAVLFQKSQAELAIIVGPVQIIFGYGY